MGMLYLVTTTRGQVSRVRPGPRKEDLPRASVSQWWLGSPVFRVPYTNTSVSRPASLVMSLSQVTCSLKLITHNNEQTSFIS